MLVNKSFEQYIIYTTPRCTTTSSFNWHTIKLQIWIDVNLEGPVISHDALNKPDHSIE